MGIRQSKLFACVADLCTCLLCRQYPGRSTVICAANNDNDNEKTSTHTGQSGL